MSRRIGLIGAIAATAVAGAAATGLVVERRIRARRRVDLGVLTGPRADRHGTIAAEDGVGLYYEEDGPRDAPLTVVLAHGYCLTHEAFVHQRTALRERFGDRVRLVMYDHRSHGRSERSDPERATIDQLGADLFRVLESLVPQGPLVLIGHSMGGMTVLALADAHPELFTGPERRVVGVVLLSTSTGRLGSITLGLPSMIARARGPILPLLLRGARRRADFVERGRAIGSDLTWVFTKWLSFAREVDPAVVEFCTDMIASTRIETVADFYPTLMDHDKLTALDNLREAQVLTVCGDKDLMTPLEHSEAIADALPDGHFVVVPEAGHMALLEAPDEVNEPILELVGDVLGELPGRLSA